MMEEWETERFFRCPSQTSVVEGEGKYSNCNYFCVFFLRHFHFAFQVLLIVKTRG